MGQVEDLTAFGSSVSADAFITLDPAPKHRMNTAWNSSCLNTYPLCVRSTLLRLRIQVMDMIAASSLL